MASATDAHRGLKRKVGAEPQNKSQQASVGRSPKRPSQDSFAKVARLEVPSPLYDGWLDDLKQRLKSFDTDGDGALNDQELETFVTVAIDRAECHDLKPANIALCSRP